MKRQLLSLSVLLLTIAVSAALNDAFHARSGDSSALKTSNTYRSLKTDDSVFYGVVDQDERSLGIHVTIYLYDFCDCPDGPKCPHHLYECPYGKYCEQDYKCDGELYSQDYGVVVDDEDETEEVHLVPCNEVNGNEDVSLTQVKWFFFVETNQEDPSNVVEKVCGAMGTAVLDAAFEDEECALESHRGRRLEIKGYSEEVTCTHYEDCMPTDENSASCGVYEATVVVAFDEEGEDNTSASEVSSTVTGAAEDSFANDDIKNTVNDQLDDTGEAATVVGYGNPNGNEEVGAGLDGEIFRDTESGDRLSRAGKAAIAAMAALIVLLLLLCCICWRRHRKQSDEDKSVGSGNTELSPSRRLFGGSRSGSRSGSSQTDDDMTYMTSDFNNLGMHHSKLDVHACSSASCDQCNPIMRQQTAGVYFVGSGSGSPLSDIVEEECKSSSEYKSEQSYVPGEGNDAIPPPPSHPPPNEDSEVNEKKGFFSRFRRNKAQASSGSPVVSSVGGSDIGDEQIEIEI